MRFLVLRRIRKQKSGLLSIGRFTPLEANRPGAVVAAPSAGRPLTGRAATTNCGRGRKKCLPRH